MIRIGALISWPTIACRRYCRIYYLDESWMLAKDEVGNPFVLLRYDLESLVGRGIVQVEGGG